MALGLLALAGSPFEAARAEAGYAVELVAGYDSNPLRVADDGPDGMGGELRLSGALTHVFTPRVSAFASGGASALVHDQGTEDANESLVEARAGAAFAPGGTGRSRFGLVCGGSYTSERSTFVDPETGEAYLAAAVPATDPPSTIAVPDRLNFRATGGFTKLRWRQSDTLSLSLEFLLDHVDYLEAYAVETDLDELDYRALTVEPGVRWQVSPRLELAYALAWTDLAYDARPALDASGVEVPGTTRAYRYLRQRLALRLEPARGLHLQTGLAHADRDDTHAGYYDNARMTLFAAVEWNPATRSSLRVFAQASEVDYDRATVVTELGRGEVRASETLRLVARFERSWTRRLRWFVEGGGEREEDADAVFTHDRRWSLAGLRLQG